METAKESPNAFAMKITIGERTKYYAKRGRHGRLYNPIGMFSEGRATKRLGHAGRIGMEIYRNRRKGFYIL